MPGFDDEGRPGKPGGLDNVGNPGAPWDWAPAGVDGMPPALDCAPLWPDWDGVDGIPLCPDCDGVDGIPPGFDGDGDEGEPPELGEPGDGNDGELLELDELDELGEGIDGELLGDEGDCGPWEPLGCGGVGKPLGLDEDGGEGWDCCELCWVWVSQAASAAITPPARASRASNTDLEIKVFIFVPPRTASPQTTTPLPFHGCIP